MEEAKSKVYVLLDVDKIIRCEGAYTTPADLTGWTLIDEGAGDRYNLAQSHYFEGGLYTSDGICHWKYVDGQCMLRTDAEIEADRLPSLKAAKLAEINAACTAAIVAGCDVALSDGSTGRISLTDEDQINLTTAAGAVQQGAAGYPYHLDGQLCAIYPAADIIAMGEAATAHKLYHTTYANHLFAWVRRCDTLEDVAAITYGSALPDDLAANMTAILEAASNA